MNVWLWAATVLLFGFVPLGVTAFRGEAMDRFAGWSAASMLTVLELLVLAQGMRRPAFFDLALAAALLAYGAGMVFVRFFERWL